MSSQQLAMTVGMRLSKSEEGRLPVETSFQHKAAILRSAKKCGAPGRLACTLRLARLLAGRLGRRQTPSEGVASSPAVVP